MTARSTTFTISLFFAAAALPEPARAMEFLGSEVNDTAFTALLLLLAFMLAIVLVLYRQQRRLVHLLKAESRTDYLTHIANRRHFLEVLDANVAMAERHRQPLSLLTLDIDFFKQINDNYGHAAGDAVLRKVAASLRKGLRKGDFVGRLGGEEFGVQLPMTGPDAARAIAERLRTRVANLDFTAISSELQATCSIGVASYRAGMGVETLSQASDEALYAAKQSGRNCVVAHSPPQPVAADLSAASAQPVSVP